MERSREENGERWIEYVAMEREPWKEQAAWPDEVMLST